MAFQIKNFVWEITLSCRQCKNWTLYLS